MLVNLVKLCHKSNIANYVKMIDINYQLLFKSNVRLCNSFMPVKEKLLKLLPHFVVNGALNNINNNRKSFEFKVLLMLSIPGIIEFLQNKEEDPESELITTIKRGVLMIQRDEFKPAEQMLHVALKLAQEQQNHDGVTYIYDLLANLAFEQGEFIKAEKLFISVVLRYLSSGHPADDLKMNHMSLKLAKIYQEQRDFSKAEEGYRFCLYNLQKRIDTQTDEDDVEDAQHLMAMSLDWYARFLLDRNRKKEALDYFKKSYDLALKIHGEIHEQTVVLLNDLGTVSFLINDLDNAIAYLTKAMDIGKHLPNMDDFSSVYVNLGKIYTEKQMYEEAKKHCIEGWKNAKRHENQEGINEANKCLEEVRKLVG